MEYLYFPRAFAVAERAWAPEPKWDSTCIGLYSADFDRDWNQFTNELGQREFARMVKIIGGVNFRLPPPGAVIENGLLKANTNFPGLEIRYTEDSSEPTATSTLYTGPVKVTGTVKLSTVDAKGRTSRSSTLKVK
jgi:hexosaminidase